jgi:nucleoside 2-deoxyribosyltransferase
MKIYMAGPLFTAAERRWNKELAYELRKTEHEVFLPQESSSNESEDFDAKNIFDTDVDGMDWSDVILGWVEGPDPDSGTCWELGYGRGKGKITITYTTDLRFQKAEDGRYDLNLMITKGSDRILRFTFDVPPTVVAKRVDEILVVMRG